jgi:TatD DNase family protein
VVHWTAGVHPHDAATYDPATDTPAIDAALTAGAVAVGECGLDYHYDHSPRPLQRRAFAEQLALAARHDKPVVVHTREAEDDTIAMVREAGAQGVRGVLHCFTGSHGLAETALAAGWYISFSGIVTFKKWDDDAVIRLVPDDRLLVESDAPYLAPVPDRGKRNEPAWVARTVEKVAAARGVPVETIAARTVANTRTLFRLPEAVR